MFKYKPEQENKGVSKRIVWDSSKVDKILKQIAEGYKPKDTPFWDGDLRWRKANIVYKYSKIEKDEIKRCAKDIVYFAERHCAVMTDDGVQTIELYPYQKEMLRNFQQHRFNIVLASRQVGKCLSLNDSTSNVLIDNRIQNIKIRNLIKPSTIFEKIKYYLYSLVERLS